MKQYQKQRAIELRGLSGLSIKAIAKQLSVSPSSVLRWVSDVELTEHQKVKLKNNRNIEASLRGLRVSANNKKEKRDAWRQQGRDEANKHPFYIAGCMLYWAEGSKDNNQLRFTNYDPKMIETFWRFAKLFFPEQCQKAKIEITCHSGNGRTVEEIEDYWRNLLVIGQGCIRKTRVLEHVTKKKKNIHVYGGCTIEICSTEMCQRIKGSIECYQNWAVRGVWPSPPACHAGDFTGSNPVQPA